MFDHFHARLNWWERKKIPQKPEMQESRNAKKQKSDITLACAPENPEFRHQRQSKLKKQRWEEELETLCEVKTCWEARTALKLLKGNPSLGKIALPSQDSGMCVYMGCDSRWRDKMYKDSPENEFGGLNLHALYGKKKKSKAENAI